MTNQIKGKFGQELKVGDVVVVLARSYGSTRQRVGIITEVDSVGIKLKSFGRMWKYDYASKKGEYVNKVYTNRIHNWASAVPVPAEYREAAPELTTPNGIIK